jgi:hypothetical protein
MRLLSRIRRTAASVGMLRGRHPLASVPQNFLNKRDGVAVIRSETQPTGHPGFHGSGERQQA